jgi:hypothetical protein
MFIGVSEESISSVFREKNKPSKQPTRKKQEASPDIF